MGVALETVTGFVTAATTTAGTYVAATANTGQSFSIRQANGIPSGFMTAPWVEGAAAGYLQIKSPRMHDTTIGTTFPFQIDTAAFGIDPLEGQDYDEAVYATDALTVQLTTVASQTASTSYGFGFSIYYNDLSGVQSNLLSWATLQGLVNAQSKVGDHYVSWAIPTTAGTAGQIGTQAAINATNDQFKANHSYALLGYLPQTKCANFLLTGTDTGNLYVGGPGTLDARITRNWFVDQSIAQGIPMIPVIQANNKGNTFVNVTDVATTSTTIVMGLVWMDLGILSTPVAA